ncbi:hypothetical protein [Methylobacterium sp. Leaf99]|uniref:hypothetical protein n=1 Tax=Methylobacterium sp. Leaf99 TaxID=1736251 RepID=UPI0012ECF6E6|nr:hypothetical protein [Methylobacterium sp. Leaf99]
MFSHEEGRGASNKVGDLLQKLADTLGRPVSAFYDTEPKGHNQTAELLRLWFVIEDSSNRETVLNHMRIIADELTCRPR